MDNKQLENIITQLLPRKKQLADVLFSATDIVTKIHQLRSLMIETVSSVEYLSSLTPDQWVALSKALTEAEAVSNEFINEQARIAEKAPSSVQNVYAILAGQDMTINQQNNTVEAIGEKSYRVPKEIQPIQQALQDTLDARFGIQRNIALEQYERSQINDSTDTNK